MRRDGVAVAVIAAFALSGCTSDTPNAGAPSPSEIPSIASAPPATAGAAAPSAVADEERDGVVKAGPTVRLRETDEFGIVASAMRRDGSVVVTVDRVDSLTGDEAERAAIAHGDAEPGDGGVPNDHYEVNDNPTTRTYTLAAHPDIWKANPSDVGSPKPMTVDEWLAYVNKRTEYPPMFHFDVERDEVVGIEQQYFP